MHNYGESTSNYKMAEKSMTLIPQLGLCLCLMPADPGLPIKLTTQHMCQPGWLKIDSDLQL